MNLAKYLHMDKLSLGNIFDVKNNSMNIIRVIAAIAVIYGHANVITGKGPPDIFLKYVGYKFIGGVAVDVFFLLSGFLITASAMNGRGIIYFAISRFLRIYPGLIICVLISVLVLGPSFTNDGNYWNSEQTWRYLIFNGSAYSTEYFLPGVFSDLRDRAVNGSLWSLTVEVRLYLIVGILTCLGLFANKIFFNITFFLAIILGYFYEGIYGKIFGPENHIHVAFMFMIGSFFWVNRFSIILNPIVLIFMLAIAVTQRGLYTFPVVYTVVLPYLVFYFAAGKWGSWYNKMGDYSYGIYLYGWICQQLVFILIPKITNIEITLLSSVLATLCGVISWNLVEKPCQRIKRQISSINNHEV